MKLFPILVASVAIVASAACSAEKDKGATQVASAPGLTTLFFNAINSTNIGMIESRSGLSFKEKARFVRIARRDMRWKKL